MNVITKYGVYKQWNIRRLIKMKKILTNALVWVKLEDVKLSELSLSQIGHMLGDPLIQDA